MSMINKNFLSLSSKIPVKKTISEEEKKQPIKEEPPKPTPEPQPKTIAPSSKKAESQLDKNLLMAYRGIDINYVESAKTKSSVIYTVPKLSYEKSFVKEEEKPAIVDKSVINNSRISSDYKNSTTKSGSQGYKSSAVSSARDMAKSDLNAIAEAMKKELKKEFGAKYDEAAIQKVINQAADSTIQLFEDNQFSRKSNRGKADSSEQAFIFNNTAFFGLAGKCIYNVEALANTFIEKYNEITKTNFEQEQQLKKDAANPAKVSKSIMTKTSLASEYKSALGKITPSGSNGAALSIAQSIATDDLTKISTEILKEMKAKLGADFDEKLVKASINEAIKKTLDYFTDNKSSNSKRSYLADKEDKGFVSSKKSGLFTSKTVYSYNVQTLSDMFIDNFNTINESKFNDKKTINDNINKKKAELIEKKDNIKASYSLSSNFVIFNSNFDKEFDKALSSLNADNYKNAEKIVEESLKNTFANMNCNSSNALQNKLDNLLSSSSQNYRQMYCPNISESEFNKLFNNVKNEILAEVKGQNTCNLREVTNKFDEKVIQAINISKSSPSASTRTVSSTKGRIDVVGSNGYAISFIPSKDNSSTDIITICGKDKVVYTITLNVSTLENFNEMNLLNLLKDIKPSLMKDFLKEVSTIDIVNLLPNDQPGSTARAAADAGNGKIYFVFDVGGWYHNGEEFNPFTATVLAHEIGHLLDSKNNAYSNQSGNGKENMDLFWELEKLLPEKEFKNNYYGLKSINELFAEYYTFTMCGNTDNKFKELLNELQNCKEINKAKEKNGVDKKIIKEETKKIKENINKLIKIFKKIINDTKNSPDKERNDSTKVTNQKPENTPNVEIPTVDNDGSTEDNNQDENQNNVPENNFDDLWNNDDYQTNEDNNPSDESDHNNDNNDSQPELPTYEPPSHETGDSSDNNFNVETGSIENGGLDAGIMPEITPNGGDDNGFSSNYTQEQLDQIHDYYQNQLEQQYGDGYQIDVTVDSNGNVSWHVMSEIEDGPVGDITGDSGLINNDDDKNGYDENGYDKDGYNEDGFNEDGFNEDGFDRNGYDENGFNEDGYDQGGYNENGFNEDGYDRNGYNENGYNEWGYNENGFNEQGYDEWGYNEEGYDENGYNIDGYNEWGYDEKGYNEQGYDEWGYDQNGFDINGYNIDGYDANGNTERDGSNDDYISNIPGFGSQGTPVVDKYGNIIGYR